MIVKVELQPFVAGRFLSAHTISSHFTTIEAARRLLNRRGQNREWSGIVMNQRARCLCYTKTATAGGPGRSTIRALRAT